MAPTPVPASLSISPILFIGSYLLCGKGGSVLTDENPEAESAQAQRQGTGAGRVPAHSDRTPDTD